MTPRLAARPGSLFHLLVVGLILTGAVLLIRGVTGRLFPGPDRSSLATADSSRNSEPLPIRRLAEREGGDLALEAIEASGGWAAWSRRGAAGYRLDGVLFGSEGQIHENRSERHFIQLRGPARVRIVAEDGSYQVGFGSLGAWGAGRKTDGRWDPSAGPGAMPGRTLRDLTLDAYWIFGLPFNLGEADAEFQGPAERAAGDSLIRLDVVYPPAPGDTLGRVCRLGFDPDSGHILEVLFLTRGTPADLSAEEASEDSADGSFAEEGPLAGRPRPFLLQLTGYTDFDGTWRPTRRALFEANAGGPGKRIYEQRLSDLEWDPVLEDGAFEAPPPP